MSQSLKTQVRNKLISQYTRIFGHWTKTKYGLGTNAILCPSARPSIIFVVISNQLHFIFGEHYTKPRI